MAAVAAVKRFGFLRPFVTIENIKSDITKLKALQPEIVVPASQLTEQIDVVLSERVPVLSFALGDPSPFVGTAHEAGALVCAMVTTGMVSPGRASR